MTDYETASLVLQQAAADAAYLQAVIAGAVGLLQALIVGWGIRSMSRMGDRREAHNQARHEEVMAALQQQGEALRQQGGALQQQGEALRALIERTAPRG